MFLSEIYHLNVISVKHQRQLYKQDIAADGTK